MKTGRFPLSSPAMHTQAAPATLSITVELETQSSAPGVSPADIDVARGRLLKAVRNHALSATWAVADPALSVSTQDLVNSAPRQEVAVLGDRTWLGVGAGHERRERELTRRFERARAQGLTLKTLILQNADSPLDLEALAAHGVTAVRLPAVEELSRSERAAAAGSSGEVYVSPPAWQVPDTASWWKQWSLVWQAGRRLMRGELHLALSVGRLAGGSRHTWDLVEQLLTLAGARQRSGKLRVVPLGQLADENERRHQVRPLRSILRAA